MAVGMINRTSHRTESETPEEAYHRLYIAIFLQAVKDYKRCNKHSKDGETATAYYTAVDYLSRNDIYDALGLTMNGKECLYILDHKKWNELQPLFTMV